MIRKVVLTVFSVLLMSACQQELQQPQYEYVLSNPAESGSQYPDLYKDSSGRIYMSWLSGIEEDIAALQYSTFQDGRWTEPGTVEVDTEFFVNWADFPSVVGYNGTELAAHRLKKIEGGPYAYDIEIYFFNEETDRWGEVVTPHQDQTATEHGFVSLEPVDSTKVLAIWLDGRNTEGRAHDEYSDTSKSMMLRSAEVSKSGEITNKLVIDDTVCDCCQTDLAKTENGFIAVYRGRTTDEIRDIKIARYYTDTGIWDKPVSVHADNWKIMACPVNGPSVAASGDRVAVAWYTGADDNPRVLMARSADGGNSFGEPVEIAGAGDNVLGRTDLVMTGDGSVFVSWLQQVNGNGWVMLREVRPDGTLAEPELIGITASSRISGFPRMEIAENSIIFAWTQTEPLFRVRTAKVDL